MENSNEGNIFINGRAQIIEMFQYLTSEERERLLKQIRFKNPQLADELQESSVTFDLLTSLPDYTVERIISYVKAPIMGVALKSFKIHDQRRVLGLCDREYAEEAYKVMTTRLTNEGRDIERARERVKSIMVAMNKKRLISF